MKYIQSLVLGMLLFCSSCGDYLDIVPEDDVLSYETIFSTREAADKWITSMHMLFLGGSFSSIQYAPGFVGADEFVAHEFVRLGTASTGVASERYVEAALIGDGLQMSQEPYCNIWMDGSYYYYIRMANTFLDNIHKVKNIENSERSQWIAEVKAFKAFLYFELVRRYGPIVLVPQNIGVEASLEEMKQPRSHVDTCFKAIVNLLDEAIPDLLTDNERLTIRKAYFGKEGALALKARALLYAASPLFNGNEVYANFKNTRGEPLFSQKVDKEKWRIAAEAADEAVKICEQAGKKLISGRIRRNSQLQNVMDDIEWSVLPQNFINDEALFCMKRDSKVDYFLMPYNQNDSYLMGCVTPSMKMVEMFYTINGLPIDDDKTWNYSGRYQMAKEISEFYKDVVPLNEEVLGLHLKREPRFYANIAADGCYWRRGPSSDMSKYKVEACRGEQWGIRESRIITTTPQNLSGYWCKKWSNSDIATDYYSDNISGYNFVMPIIRLAELYLIQAEAWNEYLDAPNEKVYVPLNVVRARAGIPDVEVAWKSYAKNPEKVTTQKGMREIIRQEWNIEYAFEGYRFWNLRRWKEAHNELNEPLKGWIVLGENAREFYNDYRGPVTVWSRRGFSSPRDYFFPIKAEEVMVSGIVQNPGW